MAVFVAKDEGLLVAALRSGALPDALTVAPVRWANTPEGVALQLPTTPSPLLRTALKDAGFVPRRSGLPDATEASCWAEVVRCAPAPDPALPLAQALFLVPYEEAAAATSLLLSLGCTDQESMSFAGLGESGDARWSVIRAVEPPYYALLRLERAYLPTSPGVWVRVGWTHPLAAVLRAPAGQHLLVDPHSTWFHLDDGPWVTLREQLEVQTPARRHTRPLDPPRLRVELELTPTSSGAPPALWVLRHEGRAQLDTLVSSTPSSTLEGLQFAVVETNAEPTIVLRPSRTARVSPPLSFRHAEAYAPHPRLERLFLPLRTNVSPPLRTEQLAQALVPDPDDIAWLVPTGDSHPRPFAVESLSENAFAPLPDWIDYVASQHRDALQVWMDDTVFAFESFTRLRDPAPTEPAPRERSPRRRRYTAPSELSPVPQTPASSPASEVTPAAMPLTLTEVPRADARATALEQALLEDLSRTRDPDAWLTLARHYHASGRDREGCLAWAHALALVPDAARSEVARQAVGAFGTTESRRLVPNPSAHQATRTVLHALALDTVPTAMADWIRAHDALLDTRSYWAFWEHWSAATHDPLARARATDSVLERLRGGLAPRDVPAFVRADGSNPDGLSSDTLCNTLSELRLALAHTARARSPAEAPEGLTRCYTELAFAWGFARLGRDDACDAALEASEQAFRSASGDPNDPVHQHARAAYRERIVQARDGVHLHAPLSVERRRELGAMPKMERYKVDRLRQASRILDSAADLDPFARFSIGHEDGLPPDARPEVLARALDERLASSTLDDAAVFEVLRWSALLPAHLASMRLPALRSACDALPGPMQASALETLLRLASTCERDDEVREVFEMLHQLLGHHPASAAQALGRAANLASRHGLTEATATELRLALDDDEFGETDLLELACALAPFGDAEPLLEATPSALASTASARTAPAQRLDLARVLMRGLGQASGAHAIAAAKRLAEDALPHVTDTLNTNTHFCRALIHLVESWVVGLARPDALLSQRARDLVDEQEHLLRHHIFVS